MLRKTVRFVAQFAPVYQKDYKYGRNPSLVFQTKSFDLPLQKNRAHEYRLIPENHLVHTCTTSDFFLPEADIWRDEAWEIIRSRPDLTFIIATKRPERIAGHLPTDWIDQGYRYRAVGYKNVIIACSVESQYTADLRLKHFLPLPIPHKVIIVSPMLGPVHIAKYLSSGRIESVTCRGETGAQARLCDFSWVLDLMLDCVACGVPFRFERTGSNFRKGERIYSISEEDQVAQAEKAEINYGEVIAV